MWSCDCNKMKRLECVLRVSIWKERKTPYFMVQHRNWRRFPFILHFNAMFVTIFSAFSSDAFQKKTEIMLFYIWFNRKQCNRKWMHSVTWLERKRGRKREKYLNLIGSASPFPKDVCRMKMRTKKSMLFILKRCRAFFVLHSGSNSKLFELQEQWNIKDMRWKLLHKDKRIKTWNFAFSGKSRPHIQCKTASGCPFAYASHWYTL